MKKYKDTLNLPKTKFPMRANLAQTEPQRLKKWQKQGAYQQMIAERSQDKVFILHDGPPYANGNIHLGHALNKIIKDIIVKSKAQNGYYTPYVPGWDCHGLPIELKVEKSLDIKPDKSDPMPFQKACRKYASQQVKIQRKGFERLGVLGDWEQPYLTMQYAFEGETVRILSKLLDKGYVLRGSKPVNWCVDCQSSLAEAEVEYKDITSTCAYVNFSAVDASAVLKQFSADIDNVQTINVIIWTTTVWTLPANRAVAVNPNIEYALVRRHAEPNNLYLLASALVEDVMSKISDTEYDIVATTQGETLEHVQLAHPFYDFSVPMILGHHVTTEAGTGAVHTAPSHGQDDFVVGQDYDLEVPSLVGGDGHFVADVPLIAGKSIYEATPFLLDLMKESGKLFHHEKIEHSYPHCWRHKTPIIFRATAQWFVSLAANNLREDIINAIDDVAFIPTWGQQRLKLMQENRPDWCISRQRVWGIPLCFIINKTTQELHPRMSALMQDIAEHIGKKGIEAWWQLPLVDLIGEEEAAQYEKTYDILDVWFESGCTSLAVIKQRFGELNHQIDLYMEGVDQYRGWFNSSMVMHTAMHGVAPYKQVLSHGFTVDEHGRKMSKSLGNGIEPDDVISKFGADILRLWVASTEYTKEMTLSDQIISSISDLYRRIRNTGRYLLANLNDFDASSQLVPAEEMLALDRWAVAAAHDMQNTFIEQYEKYEFHKILKGLIHFSSILMGSFYFEIIKDRIYTLAADSLARRSAQTALHHILQAYVRWIAPILSFTADEIWEYMDHQGDAAEQSVFAQEWYQGLFPLADSDKLNQDFWHDLLALRAEVNKAIEAGRNAQVFNGSLEVAVTLQATPERYAQLAPVADELRFAFIVSDVTLTEAEALPLDEEGQPQTIAIQVHKAEAEKCERCWHHVDSVGQNAEHPSLCARCCTNLYEGGEERLFM